MLSTSKSVLIILTMLTTPIGAQQVVFRTYTIQDGLVANQTRKIKQDNDGFIWIATWEGLSKYDGFKFYNYTTSNGLSFDVVNDIYIDDQNRIFVAENNRCSDLIINNRLTPFHSDSVTINSFVETNSHVYVTTDNYGIGTFAEDKFSFTEKYLGRSVQDLVAINDSLFLMLDGDFKALILDKNQNEFSHDPSGTIYQSIAVDKKRNIWLCTHNGLKLLDPEQQKDKPIRFLPLPPLFKDYKIPAASIYELFEDLDGNYWMSTTKGLIRFSAHGRVQLFNTRNGLPTNLVTSLFQDREKNIWACSQLGVVKLSMTNDFQFFTQEDGFNNTGIYQIVPDQQDYFYLNHSPQIFRMNAVNFIKESFGPTQPYNFIINHPLKEGLLTITSGSLSEISSHPSTFNIIDSAISKEFMQAETDNQGNIFVGSFQGVYLKSPNKQTKHFALNHRITALEIDNQGWLWVGTWESGLFRIKLNYLEDSIAGTVEDLSSVIQNKHIRTLFEGSDGSFWIGTRYHGIIHMKHMDKDDIWTKDYFNKEQGLSSNWISSIAEDNRKNIWVGTHGGLNKLVFESDTYRIFNFSRLNNFFGEIYSIYPSWGEYIWCGGYTGLIRFHDDQVDTIKVPPVIITSAFAGNELLDLQNTKPIFDHNTRNLTFEFSSPTYLNESGIKYSYRLRGTLDDAWSTPQPQHVISYSNLEAGTYRFEVRAFGLNNLPGETTGYDFVINPPYWKTWWFYFICILSLFLLLFFMYRIRIRQIIKWQKARDRIATDLHDDIGSSLTNISILSELSSKHLDRPDEVEKFLRRISEEVSSSGQAMDDIIWSVNSQNDQLDETLARMRRYTAELFDGSDIQYHLQIDEMIKSRNLNMEQRRDIFLMFKEILNNICKHAEAKEIWIEAQLKNNTLFLFIRDNGKGFIKADNSPGNGLKNIYYRTQKWKGKISIDSKLEQGTAIEISLPLKE